MKNYLNGRKLMNGGYGYTNRNVTFVVLMELPESYDFYFGVHRFVGNLDTEGACFLGIQLPISLTDILTLHANLLNCLKH